MSQILMVLRGIPASGKSTWAASWLAKDRENRARINRDGLREMGFAVDVLSPYDEKIISEGELRLLSLFLSRGKSVIIDNTNLRAANVKKYLEVAQRYNVPVLWKDFDIDLKEAKRRNAARTRKVDEEVIDKMMKRYLFSGFPSFPVLGEKEGRYVPDVTLPKAILLDVDGTAMNISPERGPFDWAKVLLDSPNAPVVECVLAMQEAGYKVVVMSGRDSEAREDTLLQLDDAGIVVEELWMRETGDSRKDRIVKRELFDAHIRDRWNIVFALDDRDQVVDMYRQDLELPVFQVAYGDF